MEEKSEPAELSIRDYIVLFFAEFTGTAILMYIGCLGTVLERYNHIQPMVVAATFAIGLMASVQAFGHISGPHLNPCVSFGAFVLGKINWKRMLVYFAAQYTGAFFGYAMLWVQMPATSHLLKPCALSIRPFLTPVKVFFIEFCSSCVLFFVVSGVLDQDNTKWGDSVVLRLGFILFGLVVAVGELSGACLNSARALPPAVFTGVYDSHWVFHLGPTLGMVLGAIIYRFLFDSSDKYSLNKRIGTILYN